MNATNGNPTTACIVSLTRYKPGLSAGSHVVRIDADVDGVAYGTLEVQIDPIAYAQDGWPARGEVACKLIADDLKARAARGELTPSNGRQLLGAYDASQGRVGSLDGYRWDADPMYVFEVSPPRV